MTLFMHRQKYTQVIPQRALSKSFNNFISLRGYAKMGDLEQVSVADDSYQRDLIVEHREEMVNFLNNGEFLFFPEVILGTVLEPDYSDINGKVARLNQSFVENKSYKENFDQFKLQYSVTRSKVAGNIYDYFRRATIEIPDTNIDKRIFTKFNRIDGNHRLDATTEDNKFCDYIIPFCLILFRYKEESDKFSRALFHNINYKHLPLTMEQNLNLILNNKTLFPDETLKTSISFGWAYYLARKLNQQIEDLSFLPYIKPTIKISQLTFLVNLFNYLLKEHVISEDEKSIGKVKSAIVDANALYGSLQSLRNHTNSRVLEALIYYQIKDQKLAASFKNWIVENHIYAIEEPEILQKYEKNELVSVFDKVMESRKKTIFISMQFCPDTKQNYEAIINAIGDINKETKADLKMRPIRIDQFNKGYSYAIDNEILGLVEGCGYLIADLSLGNKNVYHEIGYLMGLNQGKLKGQNNFILIQNTETKSSDFGKDVGFNLNHFKVLTVDGTNDLREQLKDEIKKYYGF
jgi:hypothetical protein